MRHLFMAMVLLATSAACATPRKPGGLYSGQSGEQRSLAEVVAEITPGTIVIVSEEHGFRPHHENQVLFLETLAAARQGPISVGFEFLTRNHQLEVDRFTAGQLKEEEFLRLAEWGGGDFANYRRQVLFPSQHGGRTLALNAPRGLAGRIAKVGIAGLNDAERAQLPPDFQVGNAAYFERFKKAMSSHVSPDALGRYFEAQSVWDDTMAWVAVEAIRERPEQKLVIIVGDFHATYGGGLPDRLRARGAQSVKVISQTRLPENSKEDPVHPHPRWGARADYVWIEQTEPVQKR